MKRCVYTLIITIMLYASGAAYASPDSVSDCSAQVKKQLATQGIHEINSNANIIDSEIGRPSALSGLACIDQILNTSAGIGGFFSIPSFSDVMQKIRDAAANAVCDQVDTYYDQAVGTITTSLTTMIEDAPMEGFIPGAVSQDLGGSIGLEIERGHAAKAAPSDERFDYGKLESLSDQIRDNLHSIEGLSNDVSHSAASTKKAIDTVSDAINDASPITGDGGWLY